MTEYNPHLFTEREIEKLAEAAHLQYLDQLALFRFDAPAAVAWEALDPTFQAQNVGYIRSIPDSLRSVGLGVVRIGDGAELVGVLTSAETASLAACEHDRWCAMKVQHGYVPGDSIDEWADPKTHSHLRPFDELDDDARNFPLTQAAGMVELLQSCGFGVVRMGLDETVQ